MRTIVTAVFAALLLTACHTSNRYIIEGTTSKSEGCYYLFRGYDLVDSAVIVDGKYRFEGEIDSLVPTRNISSTNLNDPWLTTRFAPVILDSGTIRVSEDDSSVTGGLVVVGTKGNDAIYNFATKGHQIQEAGEFVFSQEEREKLNREYDKLVTKTIEKNLDNFASLYLLSVSGNRYTDEQKAKYLKRLSPAMKRTTAAEFIRNQINTNNKTE